MAGIIALCAAYIMSQFYRSFLAVLTPALSAELGMSNNALSQALGAWFIVFALSQFLVGPLLDRLGPRKSAALLFLIGGGGGSAFFALAQAPWMIVAAMGLIGLGCSPVLMATFYIFRRTYSPARFAVLSSTFIAVGNAGNLLGTSPLAWLAEGLGWRAAMGGLFLITMAIGIAVLAIVRDPADDEDHAGGGGSYLDVLKIRQLWFIFPICFFGYAIIANMRGLWAGPYFSQVHGLEATEIGNITLLVAVAMVVGTLAYGPLDTIFNSRKGVIFFGNCITAVALAVWALDPSASVGKATVLLVILGLAGSSYGVIMAHGLSFVPKRMTGRGATLLNFFSIGGSGAMQSISGFTYDAAATSKPLDGFSAVIWLYLACILIALVIYLFARDAKPNAAIAE